MVDEGVVQHAIVVEHFQSEHLHAGGPHACPINVDALISEIVASRLSRFPAGDGVEFCHENVVPKPVKCFMIVVLGGVRLQLFLGARLGVFI